MRAADQLAQTEKEGKEEDGKSLQKKGRKKNR